MPRYPSASKTVQGMPSGVFSKVAHRIAAIAGERYPLHVGDTWLQPALGCHLADFSEVDHPGMHTHALLELVTSRAFDDKKFHYAMLAEPDMKTRWELIRSELESYRRILELADRQNYRRWPKHISMN